MTKTNSDVLTPAVMQAFRDGDADADKLHRLLMLKPWEINPLDAVGKCPYPPNTGGARSWPAAVALRAELERLSKASAT